MGRSSKAGAFQMTRISSLTVHLAHEYKVVYGQRKSQQFDWAIRVEEHTCIALGWHCITRLDMTLHLLFHVSALPILVCRHHVKRMSHDQRAARGSR